MVITPPTAAYKIGSEKNAELVHPIAAEDWDTIHKIGSGAPPPARPLAVKIITREADGTRLRHVDCPWLGSLTLALRPTAVAALRDVLAHDGELLPLVCRDGPLQLFRVHTVLDLLDVERSRVARFPDGRIMWVEHHAWSGPVPADVAAFRLVGVEDLRTYFTDCFVDAYRRAGLSGLEFRPAP